MFSCGYCKIFKNTDFDENLQTTASAVPTSTVKISRNGHSLSFVVTCFATRRDSLSLIVTLSNALSLAVIHCQSLCQR